MLILIELEFSGKENIFFIKKIQYGWLNFRHGTGGHGALISFFKRPAQYKSISAFSPIYNASEYECSQNAFKKFFGQS